MRVLSLIVLTVPLVSAGIPAPKVTVGLNVGDEAAASSLGGLEPKIQWQTGGTVAGCDITGGIDMTITDVDEPPAPSFWGKLKKSISGLGDVSIRGDVDTSDSDSVDLDVRANGFGTSVQILGRFDTNSKKPKVSKLQLAKDIDTMAGTFSINPKYDVQKSSPDVSLGFQLDNTSFRVDAEKRKLTISHAFTNRDSVTPTATASGDFSLSYTRDLDTGKLTTTWAPNDSIKVMWTDGQVMTTVKAPIEGYYNLNQGVKVSMKRSIDML